MDERRDPPGWAPHLSPGTDPSSVDLLARRSLPRAWAESWAATPDRRVLVSSTGEVLSASALEQRTAQVAARFLGAGLLPGDRVLLSAPASLDVVVAYCALLRAGLVVVPMNTAYREREVAHIVNDVAPRAAVLASSDMASWVRGVDPTVIVVEADVALPEGPDDAGARDGSGPDDLALVCYTSGTTGAPKGAMLTHGNLLASAEAVRLAWRWTPEDHLVLCLPLFHLHGLCVGLNGTLLAGASAVVHDGFDVDRVLDDVEDATLLFGVPTMWSRLAASPRAARLASLRLCVSGSAPLPPDVHEAVERLAGQRILERYGMTETVMNISHPYDGERRAGTVGYPLPGVEVRLAGGDEGEIQLRGPNIFAGYWRNEAATADAFTDDGWFRSGDLGRRSEDGQLAIAGRAKELIISGGYNVYPREVEDVLRGDVDVADVAVVGTPSEEWGEVVTAFVVPSRSGVDLDAVAARVADQLAPFKRPRLLHEVDELPRNALGKIVKHELRAPG